VAEQTVDPGWSEVQWHLRAGEHSQTVPINVYTTGLAAASDRRVHIYPGLGERRDAVRSAAQYLAAHAVPAIGVDAPFYSVDTKYREHMAREVPAVVADAVGGDADLLGRSLGYIMAAVGGASAPDRFKSVAGVGGAMPTYQYWSKNTVLRRASFGLQLGVYNNLLTVPELGNVGQAVGVTQELSSYRNVGGVVEALDHGLSDRVGNLGLAALRRMHEVGMPHQNFLPRFDMVFPRKLMQQALLANGCEPGCMTTVAWAHSNSRVEVGLQQTLPYAAWQVALATTQAYEAKTTTILQ
jgi:pimeloyl-ACP methyl ester carboxylesterase